MRRGAPDTPTGVTTMTELPELPLDFEAFHRMHRPLYVAWAKSYLKHKADAEEAVDWAFEQLLTGWQEVLTKESPAAYAWQVMKHRTIDVARARGRRESLIDTAAFETAALRKAVDPIGQLEENLSLMRAIEALPERQRDVVLLLSLHGQSTREAADHLGITPAAVRSTARYARRRLREILGLAKEGRTDDVAR
ncbi:sigma-70 family RNA polymerase sigma factor [Streptomyces flavalbus]|uniref:Sigma-70 family RNA polymerase sigma factor n=1 Tax=Streptomyces flavalbus TaxID=2665155 RepID=A0ABW2WI12_9ACTN